MDHSYSIGKDTRLLLRRYLAQSYAYSTEFITHTHTYMQLVEMTEMGIVAFTIAATPTKTISFTTQ